MRRFSFFRLDDGFIGYPTDVVEAAVSLPPEEAITQIDVLSKTAVADACRNSDLETIGGGIFVTTPRLIQDKHGIVVAEVLPHDFDHYIGHYQAIAQVNQTFVEVMNNIVATKLQEALTAEHQQWDAYVHYSNLIFGFHRDPIVSEFLAHAGDEYDHILKVGSLLVNGGIRPTTKRVAFQEATDTSGILKVQLDMEEKAVKAYQDVVKTINDEGSPVTIEVQTFIAKEAEHARDLRALLRYV